MAEPSSSYFQGWYEANGDKLNQDRRERYHSDPAYRAKILEQNREARKKRRQVTLKEKRARQGAQKARTTKSWKAVTVVLKDPKSGRDVEAKMFTIGAVAKALGCSVQAIRLWEKKSIIPKAPFRYSKGDRLYTADFIEQLRVILTKQGRIGTHKTRSRPLPYVERWVVFADQKAINRKKVKPEELEVEAGVIKVELCTGKTAHRVRLFRIGVLAKTVGRTVVTLEQLEQRGALPPTPFRASEVGYRLYTQKMMEAVKASFDERCGEVRGVEAWQEFHDEVEASWQKLNVIGAEIIE